MSHATWIAVWMLWYVCIVIRNCCHVNCDLWIVVWKYPSSFLTIFDVCVQLHESQGCQVILTKIRVHVWKAIRRRLKIPYVGNMGIKIKGETWAAKTFLTVFSLKIRNLIFFKFFWHSYHKIKICKHKIIHHITARIRPYLYTSAPHLWSSTMEFMEC